MSKIEYSDLLFEISKKLDENELPRLIFMCREEIAEGSEENIRDVLTLFKELEKQHRLGIDRLDTLKEILKQMKKRSLLKKVEEFEIRRKAQSVGIVSSLKRMATHIKGAVKLICNLRTIAGGLLVVSSGMALRRCSSLDEFVEVFNKVVLVSYSKLVEISEGSLCFTVKAETSSALKELWDMYKSGTLQNRLQEFLVADEIKQLASGEDVEVTVYIDEQEYKAAYLDLMLLQKQESDVAEEERLGGRRRSNSDSFLCFKPNEDDVTLLKLKFNLERQKRQFLEEETKKLRAEIAMAERVEKRLVCQEEESETARIADEERLRRNSDSALFIRPKEEMPVLKIMNERRAAKEREIELLSPEILEDCSPEEKATKFSRQQESWQALEAGEIDEGTDVLEMSQRYEAKVMDPGKLAFVQKYFEDVADTCSMTTNVKDSGLATHTAASELGTKVIYALEEIDEGTDELEMSQRHKAKVMDPGKLAFVQKYLEDVADTGSMTTNVRDSGLATHTAASELGTEEIHEGSKLCLKDLSGDVTNKWIQRLQADEAALEKFYQFFGLKLGDRYTLHEIKELFPDTTVNVLKKCFEVLRLYDLVEILEKVSMKPRFLRPAVSPEQIEKLWRADDRPTKYHSDVAVLVVDFNVREDIVEREYAEKIETFFKDLNSRNEMAIISLASPPETRGFLLEMKEGKRGMTYHHSRESSCKKELESVLQRKARIEKELEEAIQMEKGRTQIMTLELVLSEIKKQELSWRSALENIVQEKRQVEEDLERLEELRKKCAKAVSTAMDELIHNREKFTFVAVFLISDDKLYSESVLEELVVEKLALIPDHTKLVVSPSEFRSIDKVPETLHVKYLVREVPETPPEVYPNVRDVPFFTLMIEIFNKRWQTLDLISMMRELKRTTVRDYSMYDMYREGIGGSISIKDRLSSLPAFQKKEEEHSSLSYY